jgi:AhpD family alkylhydroperoxidase
MSANRGAARSADTAKRTLTPRNVAGTVARVVASLPVLIPAMVRPKTSAALREKVVLGVTSITDCRYCAWGHTHWAMAHGVSLEEVNQILGHEMEALRAKDPAEAAAILFARHYAETLDQFDPEAIANLRKHYSGPQVAEILAFVRAITLGSLAGNTADAFLDRFRSHGRTSVLFEGVVTAAVAPVLIVLALLARFDRRVGMDGTRAPRSRAGKNLAA